MKQNLKLSALVMAMLGSVIAGCDQPAAPEATRSSNTEPTEIMEATEPTEAMEPTETAPTRFKVEMTLIDVQGVGTPIGSVEISQGSEGLVFTPDLKDLPPGFHGFHVHKKPNCGASEKGGEMVAGNAAGTHYDPTDSGKHAGPEGEGHMGDLPTLEVAADGTATTAITAPRLKIADVSQRSLMIHAENDDYAQSPGGARIACGVVK